MKILDVEQGSPEWLHARLGVVTASEFDRVITPKTMKPSASQDKYLAKLIAEWCLGQSLDEYSSTFMDRGTELEPVAASAYEFENDAATVKVGLIVTDDGKIGASPDRLVGDDGLLEIKVPAADTHMRYLLDSSDLIADYWCQAQGQLFVTGREWVDLMSYNPVLPSVCVRVTPDPEFQAALSACLPAFVAKVDAAKARMADVKIENERARVASKADADPFATRPNPPVILHGEILQ